MCLVLPWLSGCGRTDSPEAASESLPARGAAQVAGGPPDVIAPPTDAGSAAAVDPVEAPSPDPTQLLREATLALDAGDEDVAFELSRQLMRLTPDEPQSVFLMARLLGLRHRFPEAITMLDGLSRTTPEARLPILGQTAQWMVQFGQWPEAERRYRTILDEVPEAVLVHRNLARLFVRQGRRIEAAEHLRFLCQIGDIQELELRHLLRIGYGFPGDAALDELEPIGDLGMALGLVSKGEADQPNVGQPDVGRGDWSAARLHLEKLDSTDPAASSLLGRIYVNLNDDRALRSWCEQASPSNSQPENSQPGNLQTGNLQTADAWFARGAMAAKRGDPAGAVRSLCEAVLRDPTDRHAYRLISRSLAELAMETQSQAAANRAELIETTQTLGIEMSLSDDRDDAKLMSLIDALDRLGRPLEALRWCGVRLSYASASGSFTEAEIRMLAESIDQRTAALRSDTAQPTRDFLLCGIDVDTLPESQAESSYRNGSQ